MPCYCGTVKKYNSDLTALEDIKKELAGIQSDFEPRYYKQKDALKGFFGQSSPYQFRVNELSQLKMNIDDYEKTLVGYNGDFDKLTADVDDAITKAKTQISSYEQWDKEYHEAEEAAKAAAAAKSTSSGKR